MLKPIMWNTNVHATGPEWEWLYHAHVASWMTVPETSSRVTGVGHLTPNGVINGATRQNTFFGDSVSFDGDDYIELGTIPLGHRLQLLEGGTVVALVNPTLAGEDFSRIIDKSTNANGVNGWAVCFGTNSARSMMVRLNGVTDGDSPNNIITANIWQMVAASWVPNQFPMFYTQPLGGRFFAGQGTDAPVSSATHAAAPARIGTWNHSALRFFSGQIALVSVYDEILTNNQIRILFADPFGPFRNHRPWEHIHRIRRLQMRTRR